MQTYAGLMKPDDGVGIMTISEGQPLYVGFPHKKGGKGIWKPEIWTLFEKVGGNKDAIQYGRANK